MSLKALPTAPTRQSGISLLEVLIALLILGLAVVPLVFAQLQALKQTQSSYMRTVATLQVLDYVEQRWAEPCASATRLTQLEAAWQQAHQNTLPLPEAPLPALRVEPGTAANDFVTTLTRNWSDERLKNSAQSYQFQLKFPSCGATSS